MHKISLQGPVAFLTFATRKDAEAVKEKFQGFQIDPETSNTTMKLEFAKVIDLNPEKTLFVVILVEVLC